MIASEISQLTIDVPKLQPPKITFSGTTINIESTKNATVYYRWNADPVPPRNPPGEEVFGFASTTDESTVEYIPGTRVTFDSKSVDDRTLHAVAVRLGAVSSVVSRCAIEVARAPAPKIMYKEGKVFLRSDVPGSSIVYKVDKSNHWLKHRTVNVSGTGKHTLYAVAHSPNLAQSKMVSVSFSLAQLEVPSVNFDEGVVALTHMTDAVQIYYKWNAPPELPVNEKSQRGTEEYFQGEQIRMKSGAGSDILHVIAVSTGTLPSKVVSIAAVQRGQSIKAIIRPLTGLTAVAVPVVMILKKGAKEAVVPEAAVPSVGYDSKGSIQISCDTAGAQVFYDWHGDPEVPGNSDLPKRAGSTDDFGFGETLFGPASGFAVPVDLNTAGRRELRCVAAKKGVRDSGVQTLVVQIHQVGQPSVRKSWDSATLLVISSTTKDCKIYFTTDGREPTETAECLLTSSCPEEGAPRIISIPWATDDTYSDDFVVKAFSRKEGMAILRCVLNTSGLLSMSLKQ